MDKKTDKYRLTTKDFEEHLRIKLQFLADAADRFDAGNEAEAENLASHMRTILYDNKPNSTSLLTHLGRKSIPFLSTASDFPTEGVDEVRNYTGLIAALSDGSRNRFVALLDDDDCAPKPLSFDEWWEQPVLIDNQQRRISRRDLVLIAANQEANHVDAGLEAKFADMKRKNSLGQSMESNGISNFLDNGDRAAIRQIAHEVLKTLRPGYSKSIHRAGFMVHSVSISKGDFDEVFNRPRKPGDCEPTYGRVRRNARCLCNSGLRYKHCHGKFT